MEGKLGIFASKRRDLTRPHNLRRLRNLLATIEGGFRSFSIKEDEDSGEGAVFLHGVPFGIGNAVEIRLAKNQVSLYNPERLTKRTSVTLRARILASESFNAALAVSAAPP
jgi:hypothetical protein